MTTPFFFFYLRFLIIPWTFRLDVVSEPLLRKDNTVRRLIALASLLNFVLVVRSISRRSTAPAMCGLKVSGEAFFGVQRCGLGRSERDAYL